jgi:putative endonuclease
VLRTESGDLYTGITTEVARRLAEHESGRGARSLRGRGPLRVVYQARIGDRSLASRVEYALKSRSKVEKERIVAAQPRTKSLVRSLGLLTSRD